MKKVIIISISSDIGLNLSNFYLNNNFKVIGTYRNKKIIDTSYKNNKLYYLKLNLANNQSITKFCKTIKKYHNDWDYILFCNGDLKPIGKFIDTNFKNWEKSLKINCISNLKILNFLLKKNKKLRKILFFAGGGTNNAVDYYSAYTLSKILLIKFTELLDFEEKKIVASILGPGWISTKIHNSTINSKIKKLKNKKKTIKVMKRDDKNKLLKLSKCVDWIFQNMEKLSGTNISFVHDKWGTKSILKKIKNNKNVYKLRRFRN